MFWRLFVGRDLSPILNVVAQLAKATGRHQTEDAADPGSNPAPLTVSWTGPGTMTVYP
jgi:hypothetical protein